jgi:phenylalanyl-tRNA synthetase beta chain
MTTSRARRDGRIVSPPAQSQLALLAPKANLSHLSVRLARSYDVYRGPGLEIGTKSIALGLIFQDFSSTLTDEDVDQNVASIVAGLRVSLNAKIRE